MRSTGHHQDQELEHFKKMNLNKQYKYNGEDNEVKLSFPP
jgi:hypothetical protein